MAVKSDGTVTKTGETASKLSTPIVILATAVLIFFIALTLYLYKFVDAEEPAWQRMIYLYGGIQAVAFGAAGYLFGREVSRKQAEDAEKRADEKTKEADDAKTKGHELKGMILGKLPSASGPKATYDSLSPTEAKARGDLDDLAATARAFFP